MKDLEPYKRLTLAAAFLLMQSAGALDDLAEMFIKRLLAIHQKGEVAALVSEEQFINQHGNANSPILRGHYKAFRVRDYIVAPLTIQ